MSHFRVALVGNPNTGKTTLFNELTGSTQKIGNWPGVTVERKSGHFIWQSYQVEVIDLPGTYTLNLAHHESSLDESIACDYILHEGVDLIVNIVDASNLERNLYLTDQLLALGKPVIVALNMMDVAKSGGTKIDIDKLSSQLGTPVSPLVANRQKGVDALRDQIIESACKDSVLEYQLEFPEALHNAVNTVARAIATHDAGKPIDTVEDGLITPEYTQIAIRLFENDIELYNELEPELVQVFEQTRASVESELSESCDILIADARYQSIHTICENACQQHVPKRIGISKLIDKIVLNRVLGMPIFLLVMYSLFFVAMNIGGVFQDFLDLTSDAVLIDGVSHFLSEMGAGTAATVIIANGIGQGLCTVITFIPVLFFMFLFLSMLEDSGYMARAAFVMDRLMRAVGLPGKAFVPMIIGFGCNVPSIMATRTLDNRRDRIMTSMMAPFMSCGARLAIFAVFTSAFFKHGGHNIIFCLYLIGVLAAIITGLFLRKTLLRGDTTPFVMELPTYHRPDWRTVFRATMTRTRGFLNRAGRIIIPVCIGLALLNSIDHRGQWVENPVKQTPLVQTLGQELTPLLHPMGITSDNWPATIGLVSGVLAKEVVIGTLDTLYSQEIDEGQPTADSSTMGSKMSEAFTTLKTNVLQLPTVFAHPFSHHPDLVDIDKRLYGVMHHHFDGRIGAFAYLLFILLYFPCVSTLAVLSKEVGRRWAWFSLFWSTGLAYGAATVAYQIGTYREHPHVSAQLITFTLLSIFALFMTMRLLSNTGANKALADEAT